MGPADDRFTIIPDLDPVIHAVARLRITVALAALPPGDSVTFPRLQELLALTAGNLSTHLRKLEDAGYVTSDKAYRLKKPVTYVALTELNRAATPSRPIEPPSGHWWSGSTNPIPRQLNPRAQRRFRRRWVRACGVRRLPGRHPPIQHQPWLT